MMMTLSIILAIVVFGLVSTICSFFENGVRPLKKVKDESGNEVYTKISRNNLIKSAIIGAEVGLINYLSPKLVGALWLAPIFLIAMLAISGYLIYWFQKEGSSLKELLAFSLLILLVYLTTMSAAWMTTGLFASNAFMVSLVTLIPKLVLIGSFGFFIISMILFRIELSNPKDKVAEANEPKKEKKPKKEKTPEQKAKAEERKAKLLKALPWILGAIFAIALILLLIFGLDWGGKSKGGSGSGGDKNPSVETTWYGFYNPSLLNDETADNDFDFGYNLADFETDLEAGDYDADLRERMAIDPKLGAATMAWVDANVGTRFLGTFYDECKGEWASTMNLAAERWIDDEEGYKEKLKTFFAFLDTASVDLKNGKGIEDQMYMNPYTSGIPDIIVLKTDQDKGLFLAYTFKIKGNLKVVMYRTDCGYQPTNVEKVMNITPQEKPKASTTPTSNPSSEDPDPTKPTYKKDPTQGTQGDVVGPNDNPGPGPDTNNGKGATESKEQQPEASINLPTYQDYEKEIDDLKDVNETQQEGTGNGGIDKPTSITKPATTTDGESVDSNGAGEAWGGPPDA